MFAGSSLRFFARTIVRTSKMKACTINYNYKPQALWAAPCTARRHCIFVVEEVPITTTATINTGLIRRQTLIYRHCQTRSNDFLAINSTRFIVYRNYDKTLSEFKLRVKVGHNPQKCIIIRVNNFCFIIFF